MRGHPNDERRRFLVGWLLLALTAAVFLPLARMRPSDERLWGDEGTYVAMAASLARDGDLAFGPEDRAWAEQRLPEGVTVILQRTAMGLSYSKPILYALLSAVPYRLLGEWGLPALNFVALLATALCAALALGRIASPGRVWLTLVTFFCAAALLPYVLWRMSDALQMALAVGGLALACGGLPRRTAGALGEEAGGGTPASGKPEPLWRPRWAAERLDGWGAVAAGGFLLGLLTAMKIPNAALVAAAVAAQLVHRRWRRAALVAAAAVVATVAVLSLTERLAGATEPYRAVRTSFDGTTGYPVGAGGEEAALRFETAVATNRLTLIPAAEPARIGWAAVTYLIGRHTGILVYFPLALFLLAAALAAPDRVTWCLLGGALAIVVFYTAWLPWNYFGGSTFLANRYFLAAYAALLLAPSRLPGRRALAAVWLLAVVAGGSAWLSVSRTVAEDAMSQSHAHAGLFRWLPYESTARLIDGQRDRYWGGDFVRFVDPFARAGAASFELRSDEPAAELLIASARRPQELAFEVESDLRGAEIVLTHGFERHHYPLERSGRRLRGRVVWAPPPAWRRHRFWWDDHATYQVWSVRLALRAPQGSGTARLRYLGRAEQQDRVDSAVPQ